MKKRYRFAQSRTESLNNLFHPAQPLPSCGSRVEVPVLTGDSRMAYVLPTATFLHIPKCGGTWAVRAMSAAGVPLQVSPPDGPHAVAATEDRFVFTFVRHPLTWYASFWNFRWSMAFQRGGSLEQELREDARRSDEPIDECLVDPRGRPRPFAAFVEECIALYPGFLCAKYALYTARADFIGRQESLCRDLLAALRQAGTSFDAEAVRRTPRINQSNPNFLSAYPQGLARRLLAAEAAAVEEFYAGTVRRPALLAA
jgi:hypothetical protein